eukprot:Rhum_TRINITY_DN14357_c22_g1::Rhum_TRINITY_DN14357_c22_g1_i1::g.84187::m.84187
MPPFQQVPTQHTLSLPHLSQALLGLLLHPAARPRVVHRAPLLKAAVAPTMQQVGRPRSVHKPERGNPTRRTHRVPQRPKETLAAVLHVAVCAVLPCCRRLRLRRRRRARPRVHEAEHVPQTLPDDDAVSGTQHDALVARRHRASVHEHGGTLAEQAQPALGGGGVRRRVRVVAAVVAVVAVVAAGRDSNGHDAVVFQHACPLQRDAVPGLRPLGRRFLLRHAAHVRLGLEVVDKAARHGRVLGQVHQRRHRAVDLDCKLDAKPPQLLVPRRLPRLVLGLLLVPRLRHLLQRLHREVQALRHRQLLVARRRLRSVVLPFTAFVSALRALHRRSRLSCLLLASLRIRRCRLTRLSRRRFGRRRRRRRLCLRLRLHRLLSVRHLRRRRRLLGQEFLELGHLFGQLADAARGRVFVDHRVCLDAFRAVCVAKGAQALVVVRAVWAQRGQHGCPRVAAEVLLQHPRQHGVAEGDVVRAAAALRRVRQRGDHLAQAHERPVDVRALLQRRTRGTRLRCTLRACEVHEVDLRDLLGTAGSDLGKDDCEDGVAAAGGAVHVGAGYGAHFVSVLHHVLDVGERVYDHLGEAFDVGTGDGVLPRLHLLRHRVQQTPALLVVDLEVRHLDVRLPTLLGLRHVVAARKEIVADARDDARVVLRPHHRVRLSAARLPVSEQAVVEAVESRVQDLRPDAVEHIFLRRKRFLLRVERPERKVERKSVRPLRPAAGGGDAGCVVVHFEHILRPAGTLTRVERTGPHSNGHSVRHLFNARCPRASSISLPQTGGKKEQSPFPSRPLTPYTSGPQ